MPQCLAPFGGQIEPGVALGELSVSGDFRTAEAIALTFLNNNNKDKSKNEAAMAWEKK